MKSHNEILAFADRVHGLANEKGWHDEPRPWDELVFLVQGELHEAAECLRDGHAVDAVWCANFGTLSLNPAGWTTMHGAIYRPEFGKVEGAVVEIADALIRALDAIRSVGKEPTRWPAPDARNLDAARKVSPRQFVIRAALQLNAESTVRDLSSLVHLALEWAGACGVPLWEAMELKHSHNATRPRRHGKVF